MAELKQKLEEWKEYLKEAGYEEAAYVDTMQAHSLKELLRKVDREVKRREMAYSFNSSEYKKLSKHRELVERIQINLQDTEMENSGLVLATETTPKEDVSNDEIRSKYQMFSDAKENNDAKLMQECYRDIAKWAEQNFFAQEKLIYMEEEMGNYRRIISLCMKFCEKGNSYAALQLYLLYKVGNIVEKDYQKAGKYLDIAIKYGNVQAVKDKGYEFAGVWNNCIYERNYEKAFVLLKEYLEKQSPMDMTDDRDRCALYWYYYSVAKSGRDIDSEVVSQSWKSLLEVEGEYTEPAKKLPEVMMEAQGRYEEILWAYVKEGTKEGIIKAKELFSHEYFALRPARRAEIDKYIEKLCNSEDTAPEVRVELSEWYGQRYEAMEDDAKAFAYYGKAAVITGNWNKHQDFRMRILSKRNNNEKKVFYEKVLSEGYYDVAKEIAELYEQSYQWETAANYYWEGYNYTGNEIVKLQCKEGRDRCEKRITAHQVMVEEARQSENQCKPEAIGNKQVGFLKLRELANKGNTYAALRFAQIAEQDPYLKNKVKDFPKATEIFSCYKKAAEVGEFEAISRMAEIYENGQLGQSKDLAAAEKWRTKLC